MPAVQPPPPNPEPARAQLRSNLAAYFHGQATAAPSGYPTWGTSGSGYGQLSQPQQLLVGDPVTLMVSWHTQAPSSQN